MRLPKDAFNASLIAFANEDILPQMGEGWMAWVFAGTIPLMLPQVHEMLTRFGVETEEGVNIDDIEAFITNAFHAQQTVTPPFTKITFEKKDGDRLIQRLKERKSEQHVHIRSPGTNPSAA